MTESENTELKEQVIEIQQKYASKEAVISELTKELNLEKASESSTKEEVQAKESELEEVKVKLHELTLVQEELAKSTADKEALDEVVVDLKSEITQTKDRCSDYEVKLQLSGENDTLLSQAKADQLEQLSSKITDLTSTLANLEEEKKMMNQQVQYSIDKEKVRGNKNKGWRLWRSPSAGCASSVSSSTKGVENGNGGRLSTSGSAYVELSFSAAVAIVVRGQPKEFMAVKKEWVAIGIQSVFRSFLLIIKVVLPSPLALQVLSKSAHLQIQLQTIQSFQMKEENQSEAADWREHPDLGVRQIGIRDIGYREVVFLMSKDPEDEPIENEPLMEPMEEG
ncbi:hypothetical protein Tco_0646944 [Tanacetum coccineum]